MIASTIDISLSDIIQTHALNGAQGAIAYDPAEHLTEMERVYVHRLTTPDLPLHCVTDHSPDADFDDVTPETAQADLRDLRRPLHPLPPGHRRTTTRRQPAVDLYLIKEYSRHLGHADLLRERIDGTTGE